MEHTWNRTRINPPVKIHRGWTRYYIDAVRSDGSMMRAGIDLKEPLAQAEIEKRLHAALIPFLDKKFRCNNVGEDAYKGVEGWQEV